MPQASGRIIHGNLRPKDNDEGINKVWIYTTYNEQLELESGFRISHSRLETYRAYLFIDQLTTKVQGIQANQKRYTHPQNQKKLKKRWPKIIQK